MRQSFEQDLGVAISGEISSISASGKACYVLRYHQGLVAPDIWINEDIFTLIPKTPDSRAVVLRNLGWLDLIVSDDQVSTARHLR